MGKDNGNSRFHTGWDFSQPFGSIPGSMPEAGDFVSIGGREEVEGPPTGAAPVNGGDAGYYTPPGATPYGPSPAETGYGPSPGEIPGAPEGMAPPEVGAPAPDSGARRGALPATGGEGPGAEPGWGEEAGMYGPEVTPPPPYTVKKKRNGAAVAVGVIGGALAVVGLGAAIMRGRK